MHNFNVTITHLEVCDEDLTLVHTFNQIEVKEPYKFPGALLFVDKMPYTHPRYSQNII